MQPLSSIDVVVKLHVAPESDGPNDPFLVTWSCKMGKNCHTKPSSKLQNSCHFFYFYKLQHCQIFPRTFP
jgi:hypothetical protein